MKRLIELQGPETVIESGDQGGTKYVTSFFKVGDKIGSGRWYVVT